MQALFIDFSVEQGKWIGGIIFCCLVKAACSGQPEQDRAPANDK